MIGFILGIVVGCAQPIMTSLNTKLSQRLRSPLLPSCTTFILAMILTGCVLLVLQGNLYIPLGTIAKEPWWIWTGGICGDIIVIFSILCLPKLGSVETVVFLVLGQIVSGLYIDHFGVFESAVIPMTLLRAVGAVLVFASVVAVSGNIKSDAQEKAKGVNFYRFLDFIAGVACSVQIAVNGRLGIVAGLSFRATIISMIMGLLGALAVILVLRLTKGPGSIIDPSLPKIKGHWWMWTGGLCSFTIVGGNVILQLLMGTGLATILNILGQTLAGVVIDATGFLEIPKKPVTLRKIIGLAVMVVGTALISYF